MATIDDLKLKKIERAISKLQALQGSNITPERIRELDILRRNIEDFGGLEKLMEASKRFEELSRIQETIEKQINLEQLNDISLKLKANNQLSELLINNDLLKSTEYLNSLFDHSFIQHVIPQLNKFHEILQKHNHQIQGIQSQLLIGPQLSFTNIEDINRNREINRIQNEIKEAAGILINNKVFLDFIEKQHQYIANQVFQITEFIREVSHLEEFGQLFEELNREDIEDQLDTLESRTDELDHLSKNERIYLVTLLCVVFIFVIEAIEKIHGGNSLDDKDLIKFALHILPIIYGLYENNKN